MDSFGHVAGSGSPASSTVSPAFVASAQPARAKIAEDLAGSAKAVDPAE